MNIFCVFKKANNKIEIATPSLDGSVMSRIIRKSILDIGREFWK